MRFWPIKSAILDINERQRRMSNWSIEIRMFIIAIFHNRPTEAVLKKNKLIRPNTEPISAIVPKHRHKFGKLIKNWHFY